MAGAFEKGGLGSWYWGYAPFLFKALPYDTTELFTYSQLRERRAQLPVLRDLSEHYADLLSGGGLQHSLPLYRLASHAC